MPSVRFTQNIQRHVCCPAGEFAGATVSEVLNNYFQENAAARGYVVDERGSLRQHMAIFVNGRPIRDRQSLSDAVSEAAAIDVMQALSGG